MEEYQEIAKLLKFDKVFSVEVKNSVIEVTHQDYFRYDYMGQIYRTEFQSSQNLYSYNWEYEAILKILRKSKLKKLKNQYESD